MNEQTKKKKKNPCSILSGNQILMSYMNMHVWYVQESDPFKLEKQLNAGQIEEVILQVSTYCL